MHGADCVIGAGLLADNKVKLLVIRVLLRLYEVLYVRETILLDSEGVEGIEIVPSSEVVNK